MRIDIGLNTNAILILILMSLGCGWVDNISFQYTSLIESHRSERFACTKSHVKFLEFPFLYDVATQNYELYN